MFNEQIHINKFKIYENKLIESFNKKGINISYTDTNKLKNITFSKGNKTLKISYHSFYRFSGICSLYKEGEDKKLEIISISDEMYLNTFIKPIIESYFEN